MLHGARVASLPHSVVNQPVTTELIPTNSMSPKATAKKPRQPTSTLEQEAFLSVLRAADALARGAEEVIKPCGLSGTQYNILRILRGARPNGLCCHEAAERMLTHDPDITRLVDRLERRGLIVRRRDTSDRRVITVQITPEGLRILANLDKPIQEFHQRQLGHLGPRRLKQLIELLNSTRNILGRGCEAAALESKPKDSR
jgi:DNA-binding MarR family transcriptional regulator